MRLVSFSPLVGSPSDLPGPGRPGLVVGDEVVDLTDPSVGLPGDMAAMLALGPEALDRARHAASGNAARYPLDVVRRHAPVPRPPAILAIGMNYHAHVAELGREAPEYQYWFNKQRTSVAGPGDPISSRPCRPWSTTRGSWPW